jgi:hypothetical protein
VAFVGESRSDMPRVSDSLLQATIYLYESHKAAEFGDAVGGSGVLAGRTYGNESRNVNLYFVTCDHVANRGAPVVRIVTRRGTVEIGQPDWKQHPEHFPDVAVAHFKQVSESGENCPYSYVPLERFLSLDDFTQAPSDDPRNHPYYLGELAGAGDDAVMIGRFLASDGVLSQTPTVRFGNLASAGVLTVEFGEPRPSQQECLLVESHSLPGYSGSAVYLFHPAMTWNGLALHIGEETHELWRFLGIDCGHMRQRVDAHGAPVPGWEPAMAIPGTPRTALVNAGMMTVVPAWKILEALDAAMRNEQARESKAALD